jgi:hypothetical protein
MSKVETNAKIGRMYYQCINDAAGYPNGMAYWAELKASEKYHFTLTAISMLEIAAEQGLVTINEPFGLGEKPDFGKGECKELMDHFESTGAQELKDLEERIASFNKPVIPSQP